jgi:hypothetical protein
MKITLLKTVSSTLLILAMGNTVVNANTISLLNADSNDSTPADINVLTDLGPGDTFDINIAVNTDENAGSGAVSLEWNPSDVLTLDSVTIGPGFSLFGTPDIDNTAGSVTDIIGTGNPGSSNTGDYIFATLEFSYNGPAGSAIDITSLTSFIGGFTSVPTGADIDFDSVSNATVTAIPIPPAIFLFISALAGMGVIRKRKSS